MKRKIYHCFYMVAMLCICSPLFSQVTSNTESSLVLTHSSGNRQQVCSWNASIASGNYTMVISYISQDIFSDYGVLRTSDPVSVTITNTINYNQYSGSISITANAPITNSVTHLAMPLPTLNNDGYELNFTEGTVKLTGGGLSGTWQQRWQYTQLDCLPLPVGLDYFIIDPNFSSSAYVRFKIRSLEEHNTSHFIIQRSLDGHTFTDFALEPAAGESTSPIDYYITVNRSTVKAYYRLKMVDLDNTFEYGGNILSNNGSGSAAANFCNYTNITGPSRICGSDGIFKLHNAPAGTYSWSVNTLGYVNGTSNAGLIATVNRSGVGSAVVTATPSGGCTKTANVNMGVEITASFSTNYDEGGMLAPYPSGYTYVSGTMVWAYGSSAIGGTVSWAHSGGYPSWSASGASLQFDLPAGYYATFDASINVSGCAFTQKFVIISNNYYRLSSNPVISELVIFTDDKSLNRRQPFDMSKGSIQKILVVDRSGRTLLQQSYPLNTKSAKLSVYSLRPDMYFARIFDGKQWSTVKFYKQ